MFWPCEEPNLAFAGSKHSRRESATAENHCNGGDHQIHRRGGTTLDAAWRGGTAATERGNSNPPTSEYVAAGTRREARRNSEHDGQDSFLYRENAYHPQSPLNKWLSGTQQNFVSSRHKTRRGSERHFNGTSSPDGCHYHYEYKQQSQPTTYSSIACKGSGSYQIPLYASPSIAAISHCVACENFSCTRHATGKRPRVASNEQQYEYYGRAHRQHTNRLGRQQQCRDEVDPFQQAAEARLINSRQEAAAESSHDLPGRHGGSWHWAASRGQMQPPSAVHQRFPEEAYPRHPSNYHFHAAPQRDPRGLHHAYHLDDLMACDQEQRYRAHQEIGCEGNSQHHHWSAADNRGPSAQNGYYPPPHNRAGYPSRTSRFDEFTQSTCTAPKRVKCFLPAPTQTTDEEVEQELPGQNSTYYHPDETSATSDSPKDQTFPGVSAEAVVD